MPTPDPWLTNLLRFAPSILVSDMVLPSPQWKATRGTSSTALEDSVKKGAGDNDAQRAALQAEEQDRQMMSYGFHVPYLWIKPTKTTLFEVLWDDYPMFELIFVVNLGKWRCTLGFVWKSNGANAYCWGLPLVADASKPTTRLVRIQFKEDLRMLFQSVVCWRFGWMWNLHGAPELQW